MVGTVPFLMPLACLDRLRLGNTEVTGEIHNVFSIFSPTGAQCDRPRLPCLDKGTRNCPTRGSYPTQSDADQVSSLNSVTSPAFACLFQKFLIFLKLDLSPRYPRADSITLYHETLFSRSFVCIQTLVGTPMATPSPRSRTWLFRNRETLRFQQTGFH